MYPRDILLLSIKYLYASLLVFHCKIMSVSLKDTTIGGFATLDGTETKADIVRFVRSQV